MELDDLKLAWQSLDRRLNLQLALNLQQFRQNRFDQLRRGLWPMRIGQIARILFGIVLVAFAAPVWVEYWQQPVLVFCSLIVHLYGLALCVTGARVLWLTMSLDYSASVLVIQPQLAGLRSFYLRSSFWLGNAWWVLWAPLLVLCIPYSEPRIPNSLYRLVWPQLAVFSAFGVAGLLTAIWLYRLWRRSNPDAVRRFEDRSSRGIANASRVLDEIARFEQS